MFNLSKQRKLWVNVLFLFMIFLLLNAGRLIWLASFDNNEVRYIENGVLDLRSWEANKGKTINLDGEWEFFASQFIASHSNNQPSSPQYLTVPGKWDKALSAEEPTPYGYGSYRLTLLVDSETKQSYTLRVASARSASKLYVNGQLIAQSGVTAHSKSDYEPMNIPYNGSFSSDENGKIEIVIEASNYIDNRGGGLIRSLKLGSEQSIYNEVNLSNSMMQLAASVFVLHGLYALVLYFLGIRYTSFLWFFLFIICFTITLMIGSEDKLLQVWLGLDYATAFRVMLLSQALMFLSMYQLTYPFILDKHRKLFFIIQAFHIIGCIGAILLPLDAFMLFNNIYTTTVIFIILISLFLYMTNVKNGYSFNRLYLLSLCAIGNHLIWWSVFIFSGIKVVYYPFDLMVAIIGFSFMWCRHYIQVYREKSILTGKLQRSIDTRDEFLANTSHELRNPLHSMVNIAQVVLEREEYQLSRKSVKEMESVVAVGKRLSLMVDELLDAMSYKENIIRMNKDAISLHKIATGVIDLLAYMRRVEDVTIVNNINANFPKVWGDENRIIQIVYNLLHNALKFTAKGSVTINAEIKGNDAIIIVCDTGIGMEQDVLQKIFEPYEQGTDSKRHSEGGFGLGLSITRKLVELHDGEITVQSVHNEGSTFQFTLPLAAESQYNTLEELKEMTEPYNLMDAPHEVAATVENDLSEDTEARTSQTAFRPKLLIVDDDLINVQMLQSVLENNNYEMSQAFSGEEALNMLDEQEWDLIISDVMMPGMSGYELTRHIRQKYTLTELPVLLITARSQLQDLQHAFSSGANDYVRKPVDTNEIRARVQALTSVKKSVGERLQIEAAWLHAQIQPHFFFNTINSVIALSEIDHGQMKDLLTAFSSYLQDKFRYNRTNDKAWIEEELGMVRTYLYIEQVRFGERLQVKWDLDECSELKLPPLTIQPLVENAVRHGLMTRAEGGCVTIRIKVLDDEYDIAVADDGIGMDEATKQALLQESNNAISSGVGFMNTNRRLKWQYGKGLSIESTPGKGTTISFAIPKEKR